MKNGRAPVFDRVDFEPIHYVYGCGAGELGGRAASTSHTGDFAIHTALAVSASFSDHDLERDG
jgi:hypothetical protein